MARAAVHWMVFLAIATLLRPTRSCVEELLQRVDASEYGYTKFNGPHSWARQWPQCGGEMQSPVALDFCEPTLMPPLVFQGHAGFRSDGFRLHNTFQSAEVHYSGEAPRLIGGPLDGNFSLTQVHFHWGERDQIEGSEHSLRGQFFSLEAHLVHFKTSYGNLQKASRHQGGLVVVSVLFQAEARDSPALQALSGSLRHVREGGSYALLDGGAMTWLEQFGGSPFLTYRGSLSTPPCSQGVTWIVLATPARVGQAQVEEFRALRGHEGPLCSTRRPQQPTGSRRVLCSAEISPQESLDLNEL